MSFCSRFQNFAPQAPKRKRAGIVCISCHEKKIKCDLEESIHSGESACRNCVVTGGECRTRTSNRAHRRRIEHLLQPTVPRQEILHSTSHLSSRLAVVESSISLGAYDAVADSISALDSSPDGSPSGTAPGVTASSATEYNREFQPATPLRKKVQDKTFTTPRNSAADSYLGWTGFMDVWAPETRRDADCQLKVVAPQSIEELPPPELQQAFQETYFQSCYTWCPVLDRQSIGEEIQSSTLLMNALALAAGHVRPSNIDLAGPATYYRRAKRLFYEDKEDDLVMCLKSMALFYWWSPYPPTRVHRDSSWWWTTAAIRHAQQGGFHRETTFIRRSNSSSPGLRRRIWWTLFARERLTALCQDRPCVIDPEDCDVSEPSLDDFPVEEGKRGLIFIQWVRLCAIIGRIAKHLSRPSSTASLPSNLAQELVRWVECLPGSLTLSITMQQTTSFDRDIHQLHLPYLAVVIVMHLSPSSQSLPKAYPVAIIAASCIARIFKDCLARGRIRFMMAICCWYCGIAVLALLQARSIERLKTSANEDIQILLVALRELRIMWPTADIFLRGVERLQNQSWVEDEPQHGRESPASVNDIAQLGDISHGVDCSSYLPFASSETSGLSKLLLPHHNTIDMSFDFMSLQMSDIFDLFDDDLELLPPLHVV